MSLPPKPVKKPERVRVIQDRFGLLTDEERAILALHASPAFKDAVNRARYELTKTWNSREMRAALKELLGAVSVGETTPE